MADSSDSSSSSLPLSSGPDYDSLPLPSLRETDLNEDSTRWDHFLAAPSDDTLIKMWWSSGAVATIAGIFIIFLITAILSSKETRRLSFNMYLIGLMIPDLILSIPCSVVCLMSAVMGRYVSYSVCMFQSWFVIFGIAGSAWMNLTIARELHKMLRLGKRCIRYKPPTIRTVYLQILAVIVWSAVVAFLGIIMPDAFPHHTGSHKGFFCAPIEYDTASTIFFFTVFFPCLAGIPFLYIGYVCIDVFVVNKLMPGKGRRRLFTSYLMRIILVFFVWWLPTIVFCFIYPQLPSWVSIFFAVWSHFQGIASSAMMLLKPDITEAARRLIFCKTCFHPKKQLQPPTSSSSTSLHLPNIASSENRNDDDDEDSIMGFDGYGMTEALESRAFTVAADIDEEIPAPFSSPATTTMAGTDDSGLTWTLSAELNEQEHRGEAKTNKQINESIRNKPEKHKQITCTP